MISFARRHPSAVFSGARRILAAFALAGGIFVSAPLAPAAHARPVAEAAQEATNVLDALGPRRRAEDNVDQIRGIRAEIKAAVAARANPYKIIDLHEQALRLGADDPALWLGLSRAYLANDVALPAVGAAWIAQEKTTDPAFRAEALATAGLALEKADLQAAAREVYRQSLEVRDLPGVRDRLVRVEAFLRFRPTSLDAESESDSPAICIGFNRPLARTADVNWRDYVRIEPALDAAFRVSGERLCAGGADFGKTYKVTALAGIPSATGEKTASVTEGSVTVGDRAPSLGFRSEAYVLPRVGSAGVPLFSVNVDSARLALYRVNDRNIVQALAGGMFMSGVGDYAAGELADRLGERVWQGSVEIASEKNRRVATALPVEEMRKKAEPGIYVLTASSSAEARSRWEDMATQWVVVTDIGLSTVSARDGLHVFARSLETGRPIGGLEIRLYGRNNDELGRGRTDGDGALRLDPGLLKGRDGRLPQALMAFAGDGGFAFLDVSRPAFDLSDRGVGGRPAAGPVDAFVYAERGVYRPGETARLVALVRDSAGRALDDVPVTLRLMRPDGVEAARRLLAPGGGGAFAFEVPVSAAARTGMWTAAIHTDPDGPPVGGVGFLVEDVVPARIETRLSTAEKALAAGATARVDLTARYLFGAPASGLRATGEVLVRPAADPFPDRKGYVFGLAEEEPSQTRAALDDLNTDAKGEVAFDVALPDPPPSSRPLAATVRVDVFEPGGRPVIRTLELPLRRERAVLGIRPDFADGAVTDGASAAFDLVAVAPDGTGAAAPGTRWTLVEEEENFQWYRRGTVWDFETQIRDRRVDGGTLDIAADKPRRLSVPVKTGRYRLEIVSADGMVASSYRFHAGWRASPGKGDTPDRLDVAADKPAYSVGDTARLHLKAPFAGEAQIVVATDRVLETRSISLPADGADIAIPVDREWGAGAYVLATAFRPSGAGSQQGPGRAVGIAWLGLDPAPRRIDLALAVPAEARPRTRIDLPVSVSNAVRGEAVRLTLAAVDEGILQLTDYNSPRPLDYFFGKRRLGADLRDVYGQLIDGKAGKPGKLREGGDEGGLSRRGAPPSDLRIVSLFSGIVTLDEAGKATIPLDLPDYSGRLRLMAVAWSAERVGAAEAPLVVRDPVVLMSAAPRFLATGDRSRMTISLVNAAGPAGDYALSVSAEGAVGLGEGAKNETRRLAAGGSADIEVPLVGLAEGRGTLTLVARGPDGQSVTRRVELPVRAPQMPEVARSEKRIGAGEETVADRALLSRFVPGTASATLALGPTPGLDVPGLLAALDRYPYGCVEQTISRAMPLVYFGDVAASWRVRDDDPVASRVARSVSRVVEMQRANGGVGLWSADDFPDPWLSAYAMDFLLRARAGGVEVPEFALRRGLSWLETALDNRRDDAPRALAARAYAAYVLAAAGRGDLSATRYLNDVMGERAEGALPAAHLGAALMLLGDEARARAAFARAEARLDDGKEGDKGDASGYGSVLRDRALVVALATETKLPGFDPAPHIEALRRQQLARRSLSTQESAALLLAARALSAGGDEMNVAVDGKSEGPTRSRISLAPDAEVLAKGLAIANRGTAPVWLVSTAIGAPAADLPAEEAGFRIVRNFFTPDGKAANLAAVPQGAVLVAVIAGHAGDDADLSRSLVVDLLPAGFEIENAALVGARSTADMPWLPQRSPTTHVDARDDRFVAALDGRGDKREFTLAYLVRAVTPGTYRLPAPTVEDMYAPEIRGRGAMGEVVVVPVR